jgi:hypothetical protein
LGNADEAIEILQRDPGIFERCMAEEKRNKQQNQRIRELVIGSKSADPVVEELRAIFAKEAI